MIKVIIKFRQSTHHEPPVTFYADSGGTLYADGKFIYWNEAETNDCISYNTNAILEIREQDVNP